ncbi:MAG: hypothetical protein JWO06_45 [Bacteroidota bacterium]|nr:hypothetical protein [Bacteroidota bacterium]
MSKKTGTHVLESPALALTLMAAFWAAAVFLILRANGTCGEGDSIGHYQYARYAPIHPALFFHHWAKPLFVLLASPFAQLGFTGIKIFNVLASALTIFLTWQTALLLKIKRNALAVLFMILSPALITHSLSGLTEPLFALVLIASVFLYLKNKYILSILLISFLPFVRSEGLMICGVFALLLLIERRFFLVPLLAAGHVVYSVAGYKIHGTLFWVFTKIPYARLSSAYGKGTWGHFFVHLPQIIGIPLCGLLILGLIALIISLVKRVSVLDNIREWLLIYGCFLVYFFAHVVFWGLGIFNSFGLMRVLIGILPLMCLIELRGFNLIDIFPSPKVKMAFLVIGLFCIIVFPFAKSEYAWHYKRDFCLTVSQQTKLELFNYVQQNFPDYKLRNYYLDATYLDDLLDVDPFDKKVSKFTWEAYQSPPDNKSLLMWDDWDSKVEMNLPLTAVTGNPNWAQVKEFSGKEDWGVTRTIILFKSTVK